MLGGSRAWGLAAMAVAGLVCVMVLAGDAHAQGQDELAAVDKEIEQLLTAGKAEEALPVAQRAVERAEKTHGPEHSVVARLLLRLAEASCGLRRMSECEQYERRAVGIREKAMGPNHPDTAEAVLALGGTFAQTGRPVEAEQSYRRALAIYEDSLGSQDVKVAAVLGYLATLYHRWGRFGEAEPLFLRSLAIYEKALGSEHANVDAALNRLANLYWTQGRHVEAEPLFRRSLAIREKMLGPDHADVGTALNDLAGVYHDQGRYAEAEPLFKRSLAIREKALGPEHHLVGSALTNLAALYRAQGRYAEAEPLYRRSIAVREKARGLDSIDVAASLNNLAALYRDQGRYADVEPLWKRSLAIVEKALGPEHVFVGVTLNNLGELYWAQGRFAEAEPLYKRSLAIRERVLGPEHADVGVSLNNLAALHRDQGRYAEAEPLWKRSLATVEKALGPDHPVVGTLLNNLALLYGNQGRFAEAEPLLRRSLAIREKALGLDHREVGNSLHNLASLALAQGDWAQAANYWRRSASVIQRRAQRGLAGAAEGASKGEAQRFPWPFFGLVKATHRLAAQGRVDLEAQARAMFETAQWAQGSEAAVSLAQMAARSAKGSHELSLLVRERQDLVSEWQAKDKQLITAKSEPPAKRNAATEKSLNDRQAAIDTRLAAIDARLAKDFPDYAALASPAPVSVAEVQAQLGADEALVLFVDTDDRFKPLPEETFVWVVTKREVRWLRSDLGTATLGREVAALRCGLDAANWADATGWPERDEADAKRKKDQLARRNLCRQLTGTEVNDEDVPPFDAKRAHALYQGLFGEAADLIRGKRMLVVPSGALTTLPFQVLVTEAPKSKDLAGARWLIRDHAITVLPAVASLKALRRTGKPSAAPKPMIGFGNPLLDGNQAHPQHGAYFKQQAAIARAQTGCAKSAKKRTAALRVVTRSWHTAPLSGGRVADLDHLRAQAPLPETADELCQVARSVGGSVENVHIGARATETEVKRLSSSGQLARYRMLHFATHGTLAGQLSGTSEPGLILSPPNTATAEDDGYLSGSEIASLKLDADWVILSACNTAGGAGEGEAAEALSGLARVFFYAGARALLVSHWEVDSGTAVKLITSAVGALAKDRSIGRAEALRRAMLAVMTDTSRPKNWVPAWHPAVWAPFVVVGEGGREK